MTGQDAEDHIHKEHWIPDGEPILTAARSRRRDIVPYAGERGGLEFRVAQHLTRNVLNFLHEEDVLDSQHVYDGQTYEVWQAVFTSPLGYGRNPLYRELSGHLRSTGFSADDFPRLIRMLSRTQKQAIDHAIATVATEHHRWLALRQRQLYRDAFDRLTDALRGLHEQKAVEHTTHSCYV